MSTSLLPSSMVVSPYGMLFLVCFIVTHPMDHGCTVLCTLLVYTGQVGLVIGSWPNNLTNVGSPPSEFDYTS